jgi:hypothetical protein
MKTELPLMSACLTTTVLVSAGTMLAADAGTACQGHCARYALLVADLRGAVK